MKKLLFCVFLLFVFTSTVYSQATIQSNKEKFLSDFDLYYNILKKAHAGLYKYHSEQEIERFFSILRAKINDQTDLISFYNQLSAIASYIGSLHDSVGLPDSLKKEMYLRKEYFPYPVKLIDSKLLFNMDGKAIPAGAEILSVNGTMVKDILPELYELCTADGYNTTGKAPDINSKFPWLYRLKFGPNQEFKIIYQPYPGKKRLTTVLSASTYDDFKTMFANRHSLALDTVLLRKHAFEIVNNGNTGILTINTFSMGGPKNPKHLAFKEFLRNTFSTMRDRNIKNLIVDIRKNGGGSDPNDLMTFSYLAHKPFKENAEAFTIFQDVPYKQFIIPADTAELKDLGEELKDEHSECSNGRYYQNQKFNPLWQPDSLAFNGRVYILSGPAVASAASLFGSLAKSEGNVRIVGEESMGGYYGHTGHIPLSYFLPYTKILVTFSVVDLKQYVQPNKQIPAGRGIMPDYKVGQSQLDFIKNKDTVLEYALKDISN
ncbi:S41 family peptidase [Pedobacter antarcticus]|uniref:S41 family peptidase n=1 Tax=Pedobacter antarcticus TaxID=34086 RepID=UPI0029301A3C|nr:S41 family peptidase [Pedobacter antarcticus]